MIDRRDVERLVGIAAMYFGLALFWISLCVVAAVGVALGAGVGVITYRAITG